MATKRIIRVAPNVRMQVKDYIVRYYPGAVVTLAQLAEEIDFASRDAISGIISDAITYQEDKPDPRGTWSRPKSGHYLFTPNSRAVAEIIHKNGDGSMLLEHDGEYYVARRMVQA